MRNGSPWPEVELRTITESAVDGPFGSALKTEHYVDGGGVQVVRLQNIGVGVFRDDDRVYVSANYARHLSRHSIIPGDIIVASMGDEANPVARACQYPDHGLPAIVKADCFRLRIAKAAAHPGFVRHVLNSPRVQGRMAQAAQGVTRDRINLGLLMRFAIPNPPLDEQCRIAEILDSVDESIHSSERVIAKFESTGQAMFQDAVDRFEPLSSPLSSVDEEFEIKAGIALGPHRRPRRNPVRYLRVANVQRDFISLRDVAFLEAAQRDVAVYSLQVGDLLVVEGHASPSEIGRCAIIRNDHGPLLFQNHLFRLRPRRLTSEYALLWLNSAYARSYWRRMCATSSGLYTINSRQLKALPFRTPESSEQDQIVRTARAHETAIREERGRLEKLQNLRLALMERLLTGRATVREEKP